MLIFLPYLDCMVHFLYVAGYSYSIFPESDKYPQHIVHEVRALSPKIVQYAVIELSGGIED
jgi:hypothetical protein